MGIRTGAEHTPRTTRTVRAPGTKGTTARGGASEPSRVPGESKGGILPAHEDPNSDLGEVQPVFPARSELNTSIPTQTITSAPVLEQQVFEKFLDKSENIGCGPAAVPGGFRRGCGYHDRWQGRFR